MTAIAERVVPMAPEKADLSVGLYNNLVMAAPDPLALPNPSRIDRDFKRIGAMTKNREVAALVGDTVALSLADSAGVHDAEFVHQLDPVTDSFRKLNKHLSENMKQPASTVSVIVDSLEYLQERGLTDATALDTAKSLLSSYAETMTMYDPNLRNNPERRAALIRKAGDTLLDAGIAFEEQREEVSADESIVVDHAHVHKKGPRDTTTYTIHKTTATETDLIYNEELERDGRTAVVEILTPEDRPLEYSMTLLVKNADGEWRPVRLAPPVAAEEFNGRRHLDVQQKHLWTTDLGREEGKYAVVVESTPWHQDGTRKEEGTIYASLESHEGADGSSTDFLIYAARLAGVRLSSVFSRDGATKGEVRINPFAAQDILRRLQADGYTDVLAMPVSRQFKGRAKVQRTALAFSPRVGVPGNEGTVPLRAMVEGTKGQELFTLERQPDEVDKKQKTIKETDQEKRDREAIEGVLGLDESDKRSDIHFFDTVHTHSRIINRRPRLGSDTMTATDVHTRELSLQPLSRHESQGDAGEARVVVEVVPFLSQKEVSLAIDKPMEPVTLEQLLSEAADISSRAYAAPRPQVRIQSEQIIAALEEQERIDEARRRQMLSSSALGFDMGGITLRGGALSYGGYGGLSTILGEAVQRGDAEVGHVSIVGELPHIVTAMTAELPEIPSRVRNTARRKSLL